MTLATIAHNKSPTDEDSRHVEEETTVQYYVSTRVVVNTSGGVEENYILKSQDYETMSLVDLCRTEKKNPLPEIPLIKEPAIFEQQTQNWYKCKIFDELGKEKKCE
jgi:hypothetical protein